MAKINLDTEPRFKGLMKGLGFTKTSRGFIRNYNDSVQVMMFGHATNGEKQVRYYLGSYFIRYPQIEDVAARIGVQVYPLGGHMGNIMPQARLVEWRLSEQDTENYYLNLINDIANAVRTYVLPFMEKYSTIEDFISGIEDGSLEFGSYDKQTAPIAYYLQGKSEKAKQYIEDTLKRLSRKGCYGQEVEFAEGEQYRIEKYYPTINRDLMNYQDFAHRFRTSLL